MESSESVRRTALHDFSVDDLFDFPENYDSQTEIFASAGIEDTKACLIAQVAGDGGGFYQTTGISVPADDVAELEWLSHFVEDSFSHHTYEKTTAATNNHRLFPPPVTKPRGKRSRRSGKSWALSLPDTTSSSDLKEKRIADGGGWQNPRRCSHCGAQKTPQWRAGPDGAKTLCNACGVRFKSGRLCAEYRPACSPTFSSVLHSNQHRKVMEMRRQKEAAAAAAAVPTF